MDGNNNFEQLLQVLNSSSFVTMTDLKGKIMYANEKFCELSGYSQPELLGKDHRILNSGLHTKEFFKGMWDRIKDGQVWTGEIQNKKKNGDIYWVQSTIAPIFGINKEIINFVSITFDITEMKKAQMTLIESSRLASLGEMASGIAHEINNPLTIILARVSLLKRKLERNDKPDVIKADLDIIEKTVYRISNIVSGLRNLSRDNTKDPLEVFQLKKLIEETQELFKQKLRNKDISYEFCCPDNIEVKAKSLQLSQVMVNLVNNSIDAIEKLDEKWIKILIEEKDNKCQISIIDSGKGIPSEIAQKLMTPFYTTKGPGKGTGLGLSLSKKMIEESKGRFFYDNSKSNTTFCIELPIPRKEKIVA
ncbi:MAG: PAS domain S-box protein [Bdellovibrionaceae bacterium]|nr:PAS domain S-box protein [Pseudobdellovibrionaceae bacterium]